MEAKRQLLNHFTKLQQGLAQVRADAFLNLQTFLVEVRVQNKVYRLFPQFVARMNGKKVYTWRFSADVIRFSGWRPYFERAVPEIGQKLKFKALLTQYGFATPLFATSAETDLADVIVKKNVSSFGTEIHGPFKSPRERPLDVGAGEYYEKFVLGDIVKIWFWNTQPVCLERRPMPCVVGNGRHTISKLAQKKIARRKKMPKWDKVTQLLSFYGKDLETVLAPKARQIVDFRYASVFSGPRVVTEVDLLADLAGHTELPKLGQTIWNALPPDTREHVVYSVDAIIDPEGKLWFLEVNLNPFVHPNVYPLMIASLPTLNDFKELRAAPAAMH